ncbi:phosphoglycerate mutase-like protein [Punctularia strigosozonata HHB-11173 SS5]|uniref:phosphoglycerate mutase-like protein n=1 Tax=Punctularia strigosozonata (strain HHB-11173) TaxID=741275 RepID=UPI00044185BC|nr:phosphoglycerate mutase-like protein [Punctularia strigosozonata HHB-11173 SS5]EIN09821.1 phosphoglycerate mutase-like protein [Punctularia strigosozonata HHB-11173 SS5]
MLSGLAVATLYATLVASAFNPLHHSGPASPYFDAPPQDDIPVETPAGCIVDQAAYIVRHGSRYPEPGSFAGWQSLFTTFQNSSYTASGPLAFIPSWTLPVDDQPHEPLFLSSTGAGEAFSLGMELRKRYGLTPGGSNITVWSAGQQRVIDTANYFVQGYLSQGNYLSNTSENRGTIISLPDSVNYTFANSLTPSSACPSYSSGDRSAVATTFRANYQPSIAKRLNKFLDGLTLNSTSIGPMQDLCGFQTEVNGDSRFCDVFEESEWLDYEYAHDLNYYYGSGPGNPFSATTGFPWVRAVTDLFVLGPNKTTSDGTFTPPPLLMSFTHDNNLPPIISALGLWNASDVSPLSLVKPNPARHFRASNLVAFRGYVALERLSCEQPLGKSVHHTANQVVVTPGKGVNAKKYVRVRVDNAPVAIPGCTSGPGSSCSLASFAKYVDETRAHASGDFVKSCGLQSVPNATSAFTAFTRIPEDSTAFLVPLPV